MIFSLRLNQNDRFDLTFRTSIFIDYQFTTHSSLGQFSYDPVKVYRGVPLKL